jgi:hypothetical protein
MTYPRTESFRDDYDLDPNVHPSLVHVLHQLSTWHSMDKANKVWPFPASPIPPDKTPPPRSPDPEPAPW